MGETQCAEQQDQRPKSVGKTVIQVVAENGVPRFSLRGVLFDCLLGPEIRATRRDEEPVHVFHRGKEMDPRVPNGFMMRTREFVVGDRLVFNGDAGALLGLIYNRPPLVR